MKHLPILIAILVVGLATDAARAQLRVGFHAGADVNPDAITLGVHATYPVGQTGVYVVPSVDYGFGTQRILGQDIDFRSYGGSVRGVYPIPLSRGNDFVFSPQAGPAVYHQSLRNCTGTCSSTGFGVNVGAGMRFSAFSVTALAGIGDLPDASVRLGLVL